MKKLYRFKRDQVIPGLGDVKAKEERSIDSKIGDAFVPGLASEVTRPEKTVTEKKKTVKEEGGKSDGRD